MPITLYELLLEQKAKYFKAAYLEILKDNDEYYKNYGRMEMCDILIQLLSDRALSMEVETRSHALNKPKNESNATLYRYEYPF